MTNEIKINKANRSITFINNGIAYSQFGIADEILDLITNLQEELEYQKQAEQEYNEKHTKLMKKYKELQEKNDNLQRQIKIMEKYFELIIDIGFDYDGYNKAESLKSLIDELVKLASLGRAANDTELMYIDNQEKHYNILNEAIKGEDK